MASFDENGKYIKTNWKAGDKITATKLNKIEESIEAVNDNDISRHVEADARLDALEAKDVAHDKEFTNVKNLIADNKTLAELGDYEINSRMTFLEEELNEGIEEVHNVAETVDGKIAAAETNMQNQVNQGKADMEAMVAEVEGELDGLHAKDEELSEQLEYNTKQINSFINAKNFDVIGDGFVDDTENLQKAIDYCNRHKKKLFLDKGEYKITSTICLYPTTEIEGRGPHDTVICAHHIGNALEFKNDYIEDENGYVKDWGKTFQGKLYNFGITNKTQLEKDDYDRFLAFNEGNAIHLEGARYMSKLTNIRVSGGYRTGFYLFGSYGANIEGCEVNGVGNGIILDRAGNGVKIDRFYAKHAGFVTSPSECSALNILSSSNVNIISTILESGVGSSGIYIYNSINITVQNGYFERQSTNDRTIKIENSHSVKIDNCNFENTLGCQFKNSFNLTFNKCTFFGSNNLVVSNILAIRAVGDMPSSRNIEVNDCYYGIQRSTLDTTIIPTLGTKVKMLPLEQSAMIFSEKDLNILNENAIIKTNLFNDGIFKNSSTGTLYGGTTAEVKGNTLELTLTNDASYSFSTFDNINYTHVGESKQLYLIVKAQTTGDVGKAIYIRPSSGPSISTQMLPDSKEDVFYYVARVSATDGITYNFRIGKEDQASSNIENKIIIHEVYFGFCGLKYLI